MTNVYDPEKNLSAKITHDLFTKNIPWIKTYLPNTTIDFEIEVSDPIVVER